MTQPWDFWHVDGESGLTIVNTREQVESAGVIGGGIDYTATHMLCARPFWVGDEGLEIRALGLSMANSNFAANNQPGACRIGIYACPPPAAHDMYPTDLLVDSGELVVAGATARPTKVLASPLTLTAGFYYAVTLFRVATPAERLAGYKGIPATTVQPLLGGPGCPLGNSRTTGQPFIGFATYFPYGALPASFPAMVAGRYGVVYSLSNNPPSGIDYAIYVESAGTGAMTVQVVSNPAVPLGTAVLFTDTAANVRVDVNASGVSPVPLATVVATLLSAVNIVDAQSVGADIPFTSNSFSSQLTDLQPAGPLQVGALQVANFVPIATIAVQSPIVVGGFATGGTVTDVVDGGYTWRTHVLSASEDFVVTQGITSAEWLLVGGGAGGGSSQGLGSWASGGGGGGGRVLEGERTIVGVGTYPVVVGVGGAGALPNTATGVAGAASTWNGRSVLGGNPGFSYPPTGGASAFAGGTAGGAGAYGGGGGGGAGGIGVNGTGLAGGAGGAGVAASIVTGASVNYGGGGGGGIYAAFTPGVGTDGGGAGGPAGANNNGVAGTDGRGGGGGGASTSSGTKVGATSVGGKGGDGVVVIRYPIA